MGGPPMIERLHFHRGYSLRLHKSKPFINYGILERRNSLGIVKDFKNDTVFLLDTEERITRDGLASSATTLVPENAPVVCTRMAVGRCALTTHPTAINQDLKALLLNGEFEPRF